MGLVSFEGKSSLHQVNVFQYQHEATPVDTIHLTILTQNAFLHKPLSLNQPEPLRAWLSFAGGVDPSPSNRSLKCPCHWNPWFNFSRWDWLHHSSLIPLPMFDHSLTWWHGLITCPSTMLPPKERKAPELFTYTYSSLMQGASKISISAARQVYIYIYKYVITHTYIVICIYIYIYIYISRPIRPPKRVASDFLQLLPRKANTAY